MVTSGPPKHPMIEERRSLPAGRWASSYQAELRAIEEALGVFNERPEAKRLRLVTDSKAAQLRVGNLLPAQPCSSEEERKILIELNKIALRGAELTITWCPSHCGILGNEEADKTAAQGSKLNQQNVPWTHSTAVAAIRRTYHPPVIQHERLRQTYGGLGQHLDHHREEGLTRAEQVTLSRLRSGHHPDLRSWLNRVGQAEETGCRKCNTGPETPQHILLYCPRLHKYREPNWTLEEVTKDPRMTLKLWNQWQQLQDQENISPAHRRDPLQQIRCHPTNDSRGLVQDESQKTREDTPEPPLKDPCGVCRKKVGNNGWSVRCAQCLLWVHLRCSGSTRRELAALPPDHAWRCSNCQRGCQNTNDFCHHHQRGRLQRPL